jgi:hypothetical protein
MRFPAAALTMACVLMALPATARAKGGGHVGHSGRASSRSGTSTSHRSGNKATARGRTHIGQPGAAVAVPRPAPLPVVPVSGGLTLLTSYPLFGLYADAPLPYADITGGLPLDVEPGSAEVIVDGYHAGVVDDFGGRFHHLNLTPGPHHVEILAPGYQPLAFDLLIQSHHTTRFAATLLPPAR